MKTKILSLASAMLFVAGAAYGADIAPGFDAALASDARPQADKDRDPQRNPRAVLEFLGIGEGMTVFEMAAGGGWYSEVLAAAVGDSGAVIAQNAERARERAGEVMAAKAARLPNITVLFADFGAVRLDAPADAAFTALNLHDQYNRDPAAAQVFLRTAYDALRPGGVFGVIDHEGIAGQDNASLHRIELASAVQALEEAGFEIEAVSDVLDNPDDDHTLGIREDALMRDTDRFVIRARKPE